MTTYSELQTKVSAALQDPEQRTFTSDAVVDMIAAAWVDVSLVAPWQFQEDITPVADTLAYDLLQDHWDTAQPDIDVLSVELWDGSVTPNKPLRVLEPAATHPTGLAYSQAGWKVWNGTLTIPYRWEQFIDPTKHILRVWGYAPWPFPATNDDDIGMPLILERAIILRCYMEALRRLTANRVLFKQWQVRSNNTDVTIPMLMSDLGQARQEWTQVSHRITVPREAP